MPILENRRVSKVWEEFDCWLSEQGLELSVAICIYVILIGFCIGQSSILQNCVMLYSSSKHMISWC